MKINSINIKLLFIIIVLIIFDFISCKNNKKNNSEEDIIETNHPEIVELSEAQMRVVDMQLDTIEMRNLSSTIKSNGQLEVTPQEEASINSLVPGIIKKILVLDGDYVRQGQVLAMLENMDIIKLQQDYLTLKKEFIYTQQEYIRQKDLFEENAGVGKIFQLSKSKYDTDIAIISGLEAQLQLLGINPISVEKGNFIKQIPISTPISGIVENIRIKTGSFVDMQTLLMNIINISQIHCNLQVYESDLLKLSIGQKVDIILTNQNNQKITGNINRINQSFQNENKSVTIHVKINNDKNLKLLPGMYVSASINVDNQNVQAVPVDAVVNIEDKSYIFLLVGEEEKKNDTDKMGKKLKFRKIEVNTGVSEFGYIQIIPEKEIPKGSKIISKGAFYIFSKLEDNEKDD